MVMSEMSSFPPPDTHETSFAGFGVAHTMKQEKRDPSSHRTPSQIKKMDRGYNATPNNIKKRGMRNEARRKLAKAGLVSKGDGKDVDHIKPVRSGGSNARSNLRVMSQAKNRAWNKKS